MPEGRPTTTCAVIATRNVRIYSIKREMPTPTLIMRDCHNIGVFGHGRQFSPPFRGSGGHIQIYGNSSGVTIAPIVFDSIHGVTGEPTLREELDGHPRVEVIYPEGLSIYKRGELDDDAMRR